MKTISYSIDPLDEAKVIITETEEIKTSSDCGNIDDQIKILTKSIERAQISINFMISEKEKLEGAKAVISDDSTI